MSVHLFVERYVADLGQAYAHQPRRTAPGDGGRAPRWIPPPAGVMKINVDAAVSKNTGLGAVAAVARNVEGVFCGASAVVLPRKTDAETLEALACREALSLAQDINTRRIRVASDCLNVVRSMNQGTMGVYAHVVREFKETARELDEVVVVHECTETTTLRISKRLSETATLRDKRKPKPQGINPRQPKPKFRRCLLNRHEEYNRLTKELQIGEEADGASSMNTEEFNRKLEELGGGEQADAESAQPMQVLATVAPLDQQKRKMKTPTPIQGHPT
ncbi:hypothetical protein QYE76_053238 [Lolium multiflorum]|uniref:RNase H type-1 domain-containing protein n=1 Tax=Lolium multiflorum TaxID=4521 RepID=A0AAD8WJW2_LOLMU|nr:hypothetical protein QYE76_053238 [Lolium multiflorum]